VALVKGKLSVQGLNDAKLQGHQPCRVAPKIWTILQKCLYQRCVAIDTAQSLLRYIQYSRCWAGLCINRIGPFL